MTTETVSAISDEVLDERWHMASTDVRMFANESHPSEVNSDVEDKLIEAFRAKATRMVHEIMGDDEEKALDDLEFTFLADLEDSLKDFARQIEANRAARKVTA